MIPAGEDKKNPDVASYTSVIALGTLELKRSTISIPEGVPLIESPEVAP